MPTRDLTLIALFAAIIVALGLIPPIPLGVIPVPITLQSLGVMLAGLVLGPTRGAFAVLLVIALVALGLPVLSGGRGGLGVFAGPTVGFLLGWLPGAYLTGWLSQRMMGGPDETTRNLAAGAIAAIGGGIIVDYGCGIAWLATGVGLGYAKALSGSMAFIPGDILKAVTAGLIVAQVRRARVLETR